MADTEWLTQSTSRFIELSEGWIEVLPPPTETHQQVSANLCRLLDQALQPRGKIPMPSNADHDLVTKRAEYAAAGIPEYWIVDFKEACVTVLTLEGAAYRDHGRFARGDIVTSPLVPGFTVAVDKIIAMR